MRNVWTIFRRDLMAYFTSPIGYIFMIVFVLISVGLYITSFFYFPVADMRSYFTNLPLLLCVFIPAVTMRIWAEERKENTWEMLLTFPMRAWELVIGKFAASLVFFMLALAATFTVPLMLVWLGNPDNGAMLSGYFGTVLLGAFFLAIGIFFSGFYKDQIVAFVVTLLACFAIYLLGTNFIAGYIDGMFPGWGTMLRNLVGLPEHYDTFTRGVIEVADIIYFLAWTAVFIALNIIYIDGRNRPGARVYFSGTLTACVVIGLLGNWLVFDLSLARFDVTEDKIYTVSPASGKILSNLDTPVQVKLYISPEDQMPTGMTDLERDIKDKLNELQVASNGKLEYQTIHLEVRNLIDSQDVLGEQTRAALAGQGEDGEEGEDNEEEEVKALEERIYDKGVQPFSVQAMSQDQITNKLVYSSIGVAYKDRQEEIIPQVLPQILPELEYNLVSTVYKLTREEKPVVALVAPEEAINLPPEVKRMYQQMGQQVPETEDPYQILEQILNAEKYEVKRVELTRESGLPDEYDTLAVINPREFNDRQRWEINRAIRSGKNVFMAVQKYEWDYRATGQGLSLNKRQESPNMNALLSHYGVTVDGDILMDVNDVPLRVSSGGNSLMNILGGGQTITLPTHILVNNQTMDPATSITSRLSSVFYLWGTALDIDEETLKENRLEHNVLMTTTDQAWTVPSTAPLTEASFEEPETGTDRYPLMAMVKGQFPDAYADRERPEWPVEPPQPGQPPQPQQPEEGPVEPIEPQPATLLLMGCSEMFRKSFVQNAGNLDLFLNSVDALTLGEDLVNIRSKKPIDRAITVPSDRARTFWKIINYTLSPGLIALAGILYTTWRRRSRNAYTMKFAPGGE